MIRVAITLASGQKAARDYHSEIDAGLTIVAAMMPPAVGEPVAVALVVTRPTGEQRWRRDMETGRWSQEIE